MSDQWYFTVGGNQAGPVEWTHLQQLASAGQVKANDMVWCEGMPQWVSAASLPGLAPLTGAATLVPENAASAPDGAVPAPVVVGLPYIPRYAMADPYFNGSANSTIYAGFWLRFFASFVDGILLCLIMVPIVAGFVWFVGVPDPNNAQAINESGAINPNSTAIIASRVLMVVMGLVGWFYFAYQESGRRQATLGKRALGLIVTDINGQRISFAKATGRHFGKLISQIPLYYGYIMAGTTERKQALHDIMANCLVVIKN